jgi:ATPase family protein associated with various cellular activities (AAA)
MSNLSSSSEPMSPSSVDSTVTPVTPVTPITHATSVIEGTQSLVQSSIKGELAIQLQKKSEQLANVLKFQDYMDFFGLGSYDSYYSLTLDPMSAGSIQLYISKNSESRHIGMLAKQNFDRMMNYNSPVRVHRADDFVINDDDTKSEIEIEYVLNEACHRLEYEGEEIISLIIKGTSASQTFVILLNKNNLDVLKNFATQIRKEYIKEEKEKYIVRKQIVVFTNYRKGRAEGAAQMMHGYYGMGMMGPQGGSDWQPTEAIRARSFNSVYLREKNRNQLLEDLEDFTCEKTVKWYQFHDIPSKRSYLFYGPPGTGKTSTVKAIASKYNMQLYIMKLNLQEMDDMAAMNMVQQLPPRCILLIEDIDAIFDQLGNKTDVRQSLTFSGLMNILDGISSFTTQIIIMTTNHRDLINRQALRTGRIDFELEFGYMEKEQTYASIILSR